MTVIEERRVRTSSAGLVADRPLPKDLDLPPDPSVDRAQLLRDAIVRTLAYADLFDWPLTPREIHRYLPVAAAADEVDGVLAGADDRRRAADGFVMLPGRESLVAVRRHRAAVSARMWPTAIRAGRAVGALPFVRLVAITGSLAVSAAETEADVDLFVVTVDGRLWLTRAATIAVGRVAGLNGVRLCPNYLLAQSALELVDRDRFTAHELAQMVPISGTPTYRELLQRNVWYREFLPNHRPANVADGAQGTPRRAVERALTGGLVDRAERWEMRRKIARLSAGRTSGEQRFDAMACKGHFDEHRRRVLDGYAARLATLGLDPIEVAAP